MKQNQNKKSVKSPKSKRSPVDRRALEKSLSDIGRIIEGQNFDSLEEANAYLQNLVSSGRSIESPPRTPLEQAQDLMYEAFDASGKKRIQLARKALEISPDCADAYVLLAEEEAKTLKEATKLYEQGVLAGERAIGLKTFQEEAGHFWGIFETRPYMRARAGLAECLWWLGDYDDAIGHYQEMLRLNPNDNQGIRYLLITCLLGVGDHEATTSLLRDYNDDEAAAWSYSRALLLFRQTGPSSKAKSSLFKAFERNRYVPPYLLRKKPLPKQLPEYIGFGDQDEAIAYVAEALTAWEVTKGALAWVASQWAMASKKGHPN